MAEIQFYDHPDYPVKAKRWRKYKDLYEGYHEVLAPNFDYLWPHELEQVELKKPVDPVTNLPKGEPLRAIRERRSRYLNLIEPVVSRWVSFLFRKPPVVPDSVRQMFGDEEYADVDGKGTSFETFIKDQLARNYIRDGKPIIFVDKPGVVAKNRAEELALNLRPYMRVLDPLEVKNWQVSSAPGRVGKLDWLQCEYQQIEPSDPFSKPKIGTYRRILWLKEGKYTQSLFVRKSEGLQGKQNEARWVLVEPEQALPDWDEIPVSFIDGESWVEGASEQQLLVFNYMSSESSIGNHQAFQRVVVFSEAEKLEKMYFGENAVNFITDSNGKVEVIEPTNIDAASSLVEKSIDRLFKVAFNELHRRASDSKEAPGADAQRESKEEFVAVCQTAATEVQDIINQSIRHYGKFKGVEVTEPVLLDKNITVEDVDQELKIWNTMRDDFTRVALVRTAMVKKQAARLNLPEDPEEIEAAIEGTDFQAIEEEQNLALNQQKQGKLRALANGG